MKKETNHNFIKIFSAAFLALSMIFTGACGDPHKGQVQIFDGKEQVWITPAPDVPVSNFASEDFSIDEDGMPVYSGSDYTVRRGIDVSYYQGDVDWEKVKADGIDFAFIRCGYRGYEAGSMNTDEKFADNMKGALDAGVEVGVYFFSQAVTVEEAAEEADYVLGLISGYDVTLPVVFDWERIDSQDTARTNETEGEVVTDAAVAFCEEIKAAGYTPCVYFYRNTGYYVYDLTRLKDYVFWLSTQGDYPDFYYAHTIWQYDFEGQVDGIEGRTDLDMMFIPAVQAG